jgi:hypothetical protein
MMNSLILRNFEYCCTDVISGASGVGASFNSLISRIQWAREFVLDDSAKENCEFFIKWQPRTFDELLVCVHNVIVSVGEGVIFCVSGVTLSVFQYFLISSALAVLVVNNFISVAAPIDGSFYFSVV